MFYFAYHFNEKEITIMRFRDEFERYLYYVAQIDYSYWRLKEIMSHNAKMESPIEAIIDKACGFDKVKTIEKIKEVKYLAGVVIRCKKKLDYDTSEDNKFLREVKKLTAVKSPE